MYRFCFPVTRFVLCCCSADSWPLGKEMGWWASVLRQGPATGRAQVANAQFSFTRVATSGANKSSRLCSGGWGEGISWVREGSRAIPQYQGSGGPWAPPRPLPLQGLLPPVPDWASPSTGGGDMAGLRGFLVTLRGPERRAPAVPGSATHTAFTFGRGVTVWSTGSRSVGLVGAGCEHLARPKRPLCTQRSIYWACQSPQRLLLPFSHY